MELERSCGESKQLTDLNGIRVLVTRPAHLNQPLCDLLRGCGAEALELPLISIEQNADDPQLLHVLAAVGEVDIAVFVSRNAVVHGLAALQAYGRTMPSKTKVFAVGHMTAVALEKAGIRVEGIPQGRFGAAGLHRLPAFRSVSGQRVVVFKGRGGLPALADELRQAGASVLVAETYRRVVPQDVNMDVIEHWQQGGLDVVTLTSVTAVDHLFQLLQEKADRLMQNVAVATFSDRIARHCKAQGCNGPVLVANQASDEALVEEIVDYCCSRRFAIS